MLGVERAHCSRHHFRTFIRTSFLPDYDRFISDAFNCQEQKRCLLQMQRASGDSFYVTLIASADGSGQACRVVVELAEGKMEALERSEERFRRIVHSAELPFTDLYTHLVLTDGQLSLEPLRFGVAGGKLSAQIRLNGYVYFHRPLHGGVEKAHRVSS